MPELLIEVGCEELPASYIESGVNQLLNALRDQLKKAGIQSGKGQVYCTPRRLIVQLEGIAEIQPNHEKRQRGPTIKIAYDSGGNPTPSLLGFCKSQDLKIEEIIQEGDHVWCIRTVNGELTQTLLRDIFPLAISDLRFPKSMRWSNSKIRFARPIRWILACFNRELVSFSFENIQSGLESRGHRFKSPETFKVNCLEDLVKGLKERFVEPDPQKRMEKISEDISSVTSFHPSSPKNLVTENAFLTEYPGCLECEFDAEFLDLPEFVLTTTMIKHLRFFPLYSKEGKMVSKVVSVMNSGDPSTVKAGNEWILNARLNDARFFYQEDQRTSLDEFLEKTKNIIYQDKLGTIFQRNERLEKLCCFIAKEEGFGEEMVRYAGQAGRYSKSDLGTGLVSELDELQGIVAGLYAEREGLPLEVCEALKNQYDLSSTLKSKSIISVFLMVADQIDKLVGYLSIGLFPRGSSDPFALRKSAHLLVLLNAKRSNPYISYLSLFEKSREIYYSQGFNFDLSYLKILEELFTGRYKALMSFTEGRWKWEEDSSFSSTELLKAALSDCTLKEKLSPSQVLFKFNVLERLKNDVNFIQAATRCLNLSRAAKEKREFAGNPSSLDSQQGERLLKVAQEMIPLIYKAFKEGDEELFIENIINLSKPIHEFFETTMIMDDNLVFRQSRLGLVNVVCELLKTGGDFSKYFVHSSPKNNL